MSRVGGFYNVADIPVSNVPLATKENWKSFLLENGFSSNREGMEFLMRAYETGRLVVMPTQTWQSFLDSMTESSCRNARSIARKEVKRILYEEGFIPSPE